MSLAVPMSAESTPLPPAPVPIYRSLFVQVLAALVLGIVLGMMAPTFAVESKFSATRFSS
jgi:aerobic C4-dicarboxylate transport protein